MKAQDVDELVAFHAFLSEKLKHTGPRLSPEEVVDEWRELNPEPEIDDEELTAIQEAIEDMKNGDRGRPFDKALADILQQLELENG